MKTASKQLEYEMYSINIFFDPGKASCQYCPLLETYSRNKCRMTFEYIADTRNRGRWCPLIKEGEVNVDIRETAYHSDES